MYLRRIINYPKKHHLSTYEMLQRHLAPTYANCCVRLRGCFIQGPKGDVGHEYKCYVYSASDKKRNAQRCGKKVSTEDFSAIILS